MPAAAPRLRLRLQLQQVQQVQQLRLQGHRAACAFASDTLKRKSEKARP